MTAEASPWIEIFATPTCPDCIAIKHWFAAQGIPFVERDLRDGVIFLCCHGQLSPESPRDGRIRPATR
jgi:hypothetical protein